MAGKKVLLVDDSETALHMGRLILGRGGYQLVLARNGAEAVTKALAERPDLILMDVVMPELNGFEAVARLRAEDATRDTPIIMVTTRGEEDNVRRGFEAGCNDYVTKPINTVELLSKIRSFLAE
ncbi:MAG: response regulator [Polyangiaceae bacterium]|nr:response regulator [Polyangiaceae bacterium]